MKKLFVIALCFLTWACARPAPSPPILEEAGDLWEKMASAPTPDAYKTQFSMRVGTAGNTRRVTGIMWGDSDITRMDITAGVGVPLAKIHAQGSQFSLYVPQKHTVYIHSGASPLLNIGVPMPLTLSDLAALMDGRFAVVFRRDGPPRLEGAGYAYPVAQPLSGTLVLNGHGQPVTWRSLDGVWQLTVTYDDDATLLPTGLKLTNNKGGRAIVLIKERSPEAAFSADELALPLPPGTRQLPLADLKRSGLNF